VGRMRVQAGQGRGRGVRQVEQVGQVGLRLEELLGTRGQEEVRNSP
jgi:hypothetical protein